MKRFFYFVGVILFTISAMGQTKQNPEVPAPIIFIYDASGSMWGQMEGKTKQEIAASVLATSIDNFAENQQIGLVAYGHRKKGDCTDVETLLPLTNTSKSDVTTAVKNIKPLGKTPLAFSAEKVIDQHYLIFKVFCGKLEYFSVTKRPGIKDFLFMFFRFCSL